jgi:hypothetical protein
MGSRFICDILGGLIGAGGQGGKNEDKCEHDGNNFFDHRQCLLYITILLLYHNNINVSIKIFERYIPICVPKKSNIFKEF